MTHRTGPALALLLAAFANPVAASECGSLASIDWLLGEWFAGNGNTTWRESWTPVGPRTWEGHAIETSMAEPGRQGSEDLRMVEMGGSVFYLAKVAHNELPVPFRLVECGGDRLVFENPSHDFPRRLDYERSQDGRLHVRVSDGAEKGFTLDFARAAAAPRDAAAVLAAEDARFRAMVAADAEAMRSAFAADLAYVHSTGEAVNREQLIDQIRRGQPGYLAIEPSQRRVEFIGDEAAVVSGLARIRAATPAGPLEFDARYLAAYAREAGAWRLVAWQSLRLP